MVGAAADSLNITVITHLFIVNASSAGWLEKVILHRGRR